MVAKRSRVRAGRPATPARTSPGRCLAALLLAAPVASASPQRCDSGVGVELLGSGTPGTTGVPQLRNGGAPIVGTPYHVHLLRGLPESPGVVYVGPNESPTFLPALGGTIWVGPPWRREAFVLDLDGASPPLLEMDRIVPALCGLELVAQAAVADPLALGELALTNALRIRVGASVGPLYPDEKLLTGGAPSYVQLADLDGDGIADLVVADAGDSIDPGNVRVLLGLEDATFAEPEVFEAGIAPGWLAVADLDGDGVLDAAVANRGFPAFSLPGDVSILIGRGDGTFHPAVAFPAGEEPSSLAVADLDGDRIHDLAVANASSDDVSILLGRGDGSFAPSFELAAGDEPRCLAVGDLDGGGVPDLVVTNTASDVVSVFLGLGDGSFAAPANVPAGDGPRFVSIEDLDGDGFSDLAVANELSGDVSVFVGQGDGTFARRLDYPARKSPSAVAAGDLDGDGVLDLAVANAESNDVTLLVGHGDGTFAAGDGPLVGTHPRCVLTEDVDGDGTLDLVTANAVSRDVSVLPGQGGGAFPPSPQSYRAGESPSGVALDDLDGDSALDLVVIDESTQEVSVLLGAGGGKLVLAGSAPTGSVPYALATRDLDGDGVPDLAVAAAGAGDVGEVQVFLGAGDGAFVAPQSFPTGDTPRAVVIEDFDGDGVPDVATGNWSGDVAVLLGRGDGTLAPPSTFPTPLPPYSLAAGDLDGDGNVDLVVGHLNIPIGPTAVHVHLGLGDGTFAPAQLYVAGSGIQVVAIADVGGDDAPDLVVANPMIGEVAVLVGLGDGTFAPFESFSAGGSPFWVAAPGDVSGDGIPDIVTGNSADVSVLLGQGGTGFELHKFGAVGGSLAVGDLDRDGLPDLAVASSDPSAVHVLLNQILKQ